ncbi:hypothetical protein DPMN_036561 [Dreissena polymorpha]|uniref:G-protein coupled receptors family 1 profile domain-containing protein n=1 Tax=Dreissena polymorpha TaxID=45954 RepID=A0A9D4RN75_DREPO|nr:hypothetical protein DPMN_036561 [Dreissena polymorpha]
MTCTILVINCHLLYGFGPLQVDMGNITITLPCVPINEEYEKFFSDVWTWIDLCKYSLVPFAFLAGGNACIVCKMFINKKKLQTQIRPSGTNPSSQQDEKLSNMSMLLVGLNIMFIVCTLPVCVYFIGEPYWIPKDIPKQIQLQDPWWAFVNLLMYTNSCLNFVLYCLTGSRFRGEVRRLFTSRKLARIGTLNVTEHATSQRDF